MLYEADWVLPISGPPLRGGALRVVEGVIEAVGPAAAVRTRHPDDAVEAFPGCVLLPGLVNAHIHLDYSAFRGFAPSSGFGAWMLRLLLARRKLQTDDYAASALWGAYECARGGVTSIADTSYDGWTVARAAGAVGLRARVYLELFGLDDAGLPTTMERLEAGLERLRREGAAATAGRGPVVEPGLSPHAPYTVSARLYREAARFARRAGVRLATHVAESPAEVELLVRGSGPIAHAYRAARLWSGQSWSAPGLRPVPYLAGAGALGQEMLAVHAVQVDADDIAVLAAHGVAVAHCPRSNRRLRCGTAPVAELIAAGVTVGLGTDSLSSNDSLDMFAEMRAALEVSRARAAAGAPPGLTAAAVLRMATLDGARALGWDGLVGSLEVGKRADVIAVRLPDGAREGRTGGCPPVAADPTEALVETASAQDVRLTLVDGVPIVCGEEVRAQALSGLQAARAKLGLNRRP